MFKALFGFVALLSILTMACAGQSEAKPPVATRAATSTPDAATLQKTADARYVSQMSQPLADLVRAQPWYTQATPESVELAEDILACERQALARGEQDSVRAMLDFASKQAWYADGLDARELRALSGVFLAYEESLKDDNAPPIGAYLADTLRYGLFEVMELPETGQFTLMVSAPDAQRGQRTLAIAAEYIPQLEALLGAYPFKFLHMTLTDEFPEYLYGISSDEFIGINILYYDDAGTIVHEMTHSTLYGIFPMWFEEGLAYFTETLLTSTPVAVQELFASSLGPSWQQAKINVRSFVAYEDISGAIEQAAGYVFLKSLYDLHGSDAFFDTVRQLRIKTYSDQELVRQLVEGGPPETAAARAGLVCQHIVGLTRNYCVQ